jgi:hypothetical protein
MLVTSLACWWLASGALAGQYKTRVTDITGCFTGATVTPNHSNQSAIKDITDDDGKLKEKVLNAWTTLYAAQQKINVFPAELFGKHGEEFREQFERERFKPNGKIDDRYLEDYQTYIKDYLPRLPKIIDALHVVEKREDHPAGGGNAAKQFGVPLDAGKDREGIVDWRDYDNVQKRFTSWDLPPSTLEVVLAQEDLWVYEALLQVIKKTNATATTQANASIKRIDALEIGNASKAAWDATQSSVFHAGSAAGTGPNLPPSGAPMARPPSSMAAPGAAGNQQQSEKQILENRYIDEKGQRLPYVPEYPYAKHPFPEFKMMPIRMSLVMDQRRLPRLLVECANSSMPIEVKRIRILNNQESAAAPAAQPTPMRPPAGMDAAGGMGRRMAPPPGRTPEPFHGANPGAPIAANSTQEAAGAFDATVEIYAVIYIYDPPSREKVGLPPLKDSVEATATPAPAAPAPATPARPAPPAGVPAAQPKPAATPRK